MWFDMVWFGLVRGRRRRPCHQGNSGEVKSQGTLWCVPVSCGMGWYGLVSCDFIWFGLVYGRSGIVRCNVLVVRCYLG